MTTPPALTDFSRLLASLQPAQPGFQIDLPADWLQGRTAYGGLSAALCLQATLRTWPELPPLRSAQFAFIGPASGTLRLAPVLLRQGKSASFVGVDLVGDSGLAVRATFCFGAGRVLPQTHVVGPMPDSAERDLLPAFFGWPGQPNFMAHFDGRLAAGSLPMAGGPAPAMRVWVRHRDRSDPGNLVSLMALADALPPVAFAVLTEPVPISTMTWSVDLLDDQPDSTTGWWLLDGQAETVRDGYSSQTTTLWHPDGRPVAIARQQVAVFGKR